MFEAWADFYIIVAPSAAALIGLLFVVVTLTTEGEPRSMELGSRVYISPIVFHLSVVLVIGAMAGVPKLTPTVAAAILAAIGVWGVVYSAITTTRLFALERLNDYVPDLSDKILYGFAPIILYAALVGAAGIMVAVDAAIGEYALAAVTISLLLLGIRDAWDLVTAIVRTVSKRKAEAKRN